MNLVLTIVGLMLLVAGVSWELDGMCMDFEVLRAQGW
jgi:hypothetical protein